MKMEKNLTQKKTLRGQLNHVFLFIAFIAITISANAKHGQVADQVAVFQQQSLFLKEFNLFSINNSTSEKIAQTVTTSTLLNLNSTVEEIVKNKPDFIKLKVPYKNGSAEFTLLLYKTNISPNGQTLITSDGRNYPVDEVVNYRGIIENNFSSLTAITFSEQEVMGFISNNDGNYILGKIEGNKERLHIIYNDRDLIPSSNIECGANTSIPVNESNKYYAPAGTNTVKCVNWYWEFDYDIYVQKGNSVPNVNTFANGVFNQVSTLYANDGVSVALQTIYVWTATDPYTGPSTSDYLSQFGVNRTSFVGDIANLIGNQGGGGVAWISGLCNSQTKYKMGYMGVSSSFNTVPTYSWTVEVVTHENGHLLSSRHTHDCVWNGNNTKIDGCGDSAGYPSGSCAIPSPALPAGGGTIMSYCHLTSAGINFNNGFGPQPSAQIVNYINNASCLVPCSTCNPPSQPSAISGNASACPSTSQTYSVAAISGATSYTWSLPSGWSGASTTNSITATTGSTGGTISVMAVNSCGNSPARTLTVIASSLPAQPGTISGNVTTCPSASQTYSVTAVSGSTSYTWTLPSGWSGASTTNTITTTTGTIGGTISVKVNNSCGSGTARTLAVTISTAVPSLPGTISGNTTTCAAVSQTYSVAAVSGATSYTWTLPSGWSGTSTTNSITTTAGTAGGTISVKANNGCGSSSVRTLAVTISSSAPNQPGSISGTSSSCPSISQVYSVAAVSGATSYTWTLPSGWSGTSSTNSITVITGSSGGAVTVKANNICGSSATRTLAVTISSAPVQPGVITGSASVCAGLTGVSYSVANVAGSIYSWTAPANSTIASGQGTNIITLNYSSSFISGNLQVAASNSCGASAASTLSITLNTSSGTTPGRPKSVTGSTDNLCGVTTNYTANPLVSGGIYNWTFPAGTTINSQSTNTVNVTFPSNGLGNSSISVNVRLGCNTGLTRSIAIKGAPVSPAISGPSIACANSSGNVYSVTARVGVNYSWALPSGATITSGAGTNSITVRFGSSAGQISCNEYNACGSGAGTKTITFNCRQPQASSPMVNALNFTAYPNPANDVLHLEYTTLEQGVASIQISDIAGKIISNESVNLNEGLNQHSIDISKFSEGVYVLTFSNSEGTLQSKIIIE